jgi:hypothetical protein
VPRHFQQQPFADRSVIEGCVGALVMTTQQMSLMNLLPSDNTSIAKQRVTSRLRCLQSDDGRAHTACPLHQHD